jgi:hypothetical protein
MHTDIRPFNDSLQVHTSSFGPTNCDTCASSLHFDFLTLKNNPEITVGDYPFRPSITGTPGAKVKVAWDVIGGVGPFINIFQPGNGLTLANFLNGNNYEYDSIRPYKMQLTLFDFLNRNVSAEYYLGVSDSEDVSLNISYIDSTQLLIASINHPGPISYVWDNGSTNPALSLTNAGQYRVTATLSNGVQLSQSILYQPGATPTLFGVNLRSTRLKGINIASRQIRIRYYDQNGKLWSTDLGFQNTGEFFELANANPYPEKDKAGRTVLWARLSFSCTLYNAQGDSIPVSGEAVVAIPQG